MRCRRVACVGGDFLKDGTRFVLDSSLNGPKRTRRKTLTPCHDWFFVGLCRFLPPTICPHNPIVGRGNGWVKPLFENKLKVAYHLAIPGDNSPSRSQSTDQSSLTPVYLSNVGRQPRPVRHGMCPSDWRISLTDLGEAGQRVSC